MFHFFKTDHLIPPIIKALNVEILASISSYQLPMEYMRRLMRDVRFAKKVSYLG